MRYVVKFYNSFENTWTDVSDPVSYDEAERIWNHYTEQGLINTSEDEGDYYIISVVE